MKIKQVTRVSIYAAFIAVSVYLVPPIHIPSIQVAFTLQTLLIVLAGFLFVPKEAFLTVFIYIAIGALGLPVFSGARGGLSVLLGPTGGFLFLFPLVSFSISVLKSKTKNKLYDLGMGLLISIVLLYFLAAIWLSISLSIAYFSALISLLPFVPFDIVKLFLAYFIYLKFPTEILKS
ncbi:MAG: biotin transporter BioY [Acholeplasmataceae bacterium]|nr:biotin transporter BioY [Acholeplasmataceae bacterium]